MPYSQIYLVQNKPDLCLLIKVEQSLPGNPATSYTDDKMNQVRNLETQ